MPTAPRTPPRQNGFEEPSFGGRSRFVRTPKYGIVRTQDEWMSKQYRQAVLRQPLVELGLGLYFTGSVLYAASLGLLTPLPFLCLFQAGFLYMGVVSLVQQHGARVPMLSEQVAPD